MVDKRKIIIEFPEDKDSVENEEFIEEFLIVHRVSKVKSPKESTHGDSEKENMFQ